MQCLAGKKVLDVSVASDKTSQVPFSWYHAPTTCSVGLFKYNLNYNGKSNVCVYRCAD